MVQITLDGTGVPKASLVEGAYEYCGLNGYEFDRTPDEMVTGLRHLNAMMAEWDEDGIVLGYDFPTYGNGRLEEPSGVPNHAVAAIHQMLALRLAPGLGATLSPDAKAALAKSYQGLRSRTAATPPTMSTRAQRMPSLGTRHRGYGTVTTDINTLS
jgi:hypothetical protein